MQKASGKRHLQKSIGLTLVVLKVGFSSFVVIFNADEKPFINKLKNIQLNMYPCLSPANCTKWFCNLIFVNKKTGEEYIGLIMSKNFTLIPTLSSLKPNLSLQMESYSQSRCKDIYHF